MAADPPSRAPADGPAPPPALQLCLAAGPVLLHGAQRLPLMAADALMLAWLALQGPTPRARMAELLWPESEPAAARAALRQRLYSLRRHAGVDVVAGQAVLALAEGVAHDLADADTLLQGERGPAGGALADWLHGERDRRRSRRQAQWLQRLQQAEQAGDAAAALRLAQEWVLAEPELEAAHRELIRRHYLLGDGVAARAAYQRCEQMLRRAFDVAPAAETQALRPLLDAAALAPRPGGGAASGGAWGAASGAASAAEHGAARGVAPGVAPGVARGAAPHAVFTPASASGHPGLPLALLRPPRLVGREAELAAAHAAWAQGRVVALVAEAGMGKTRLLQHLVPQQAAGRAALQVSARPGDAGVPWSTLARLLRAVPQPTASGPAAAPAAGLLQPPVLAAIAAEPGSALADAARPASRGQLQQALREWLQQQHGLAVVALDDLHFADGASLQLLQGLLDEPGPGPDWALGYRPAEPGGALHQLHDALQDTLRLHAVALAPLAEPALAELVDSLGLPGLVGARLAPALRQRTGGNPMFVLETLKQGVGPAGELARPLSVTRLIERRLAQLSAPALALARCAALAGRDFDIALASEVLETPALALADAWAELEAAGVLREQAFAHDLVFEAALGSVPAPIARHLHAELAARLQARPGTAPATLAQHWLAAGQPARAAPHLQQAAEAAARAYDVSESARLWGQLAEMHAAAQQPEAAFDAALAAASALRTQTTGAALQAAIARVQALARTPLQRAAVHKQRAEQALERGELATAEAEAAAGVQALGADAPVAPRAALLNLHGVLLRRQERLAPSRSALQQALTLLRGAAPGEPDVASQLPAVLNNLGLTLQDMDLHLEAAASLQEAAERQTDPTTRARVLNNLSISLEERGQVQLAHEQRLAAARAVAGSGSLVEVMLAISLGACARNLCRYREALLHLERADALAQGQQHHRQEDRLRQLAALWLALGRPNLAREAVEQAIALPGGQSPVMAVVQARLALALRQPERARALLAGAEQAWTAGDGQRMLRRLRLVQAQVLPPEQALPLLEQALASPTLAASAGAALPLHVRLAQVSLALGDAARAHRAAERAADWLLAVHPLEMTPAEVWLTLAQTAQAVGDEAQARSAAQQGLAFVEQVVAEQLDAVYHEGWRRQNPVNAALAVLGARLGVGVGVG
jgi:DNA-binding SARP family transcriptional activator